MWFLSFCYCYIMKDGCGIMLENSARLQKGPSVVIQSDNSSVIPRHTFRIFSLPLAVLSILAHYYGWYISYPVMHCNPSVEMYWNRVAPFTDIWYLVDGWLESIVASGELFWNWSVLGIQTQISQSLFPAAVRSIHWKLAGLRDRDVSLHVLYRCVLSAR